MMQTIKVYARVYRGAPSYSSMLIPFSLYLLYLSRETCTNHAYLVELQILFLTHSSNSSHCCAKPKNTHTCNLTICRGARKWKNFPNFATRAEMSTHSSEQLDLGVLIK